MENFLTSIDNSLIYLYSLMLLASIYVFRRFSSATLSSLVIIFSELVMNPIRGPLLEFVTEIGRPHSLMIWFGTWITANAVIIAILHFTHKWLKLGAGRYYKTVGVGFSALMLMQVIGYFDEMYIQSALLDAVYRFGIPSINIGMAIAMVVNIFVETKHVRDSGCSRVY